MRRRFILYAASVGLLVPLLAFGGEAAKTGVVKGAITVNGRPTSDAVVSVAGLPKKQLKTQDSKLKTSKAVVDQRNVKFIPRVLPVLVGTTVEFPNNDKTWHNVYSKSEAKEFDLGLYPAGETRSVTFDKPGVVRILCNVHPSMEAFIVVKDHPYFTTPDQRGNYTLNRVPLGQRRLEVWHPEFGTRVVPFNLVREGEVLSVNVDLAKK
ncbi:MAG: methylamine utilization protein [Deltaproteobacteria bacterium]|nr:methylamine utilization protein [Deltaproteobacteria bacterium]